jgi:hypothetical protein
MIIENISIFRRTVPFFIISLDDPFKWLYKQLLIEQPLMEVGL